MVGPLGCRESVKETGIQEVRTVDLLTSTLCRKPSRPSFQIESYRRLCRVKVTACEAILLGVAVML